MEINNPVFMIGTGRCGSTIIFEALCVHEDLAWFSNYNKLVPRFDFVSIMPRLYNLSFLKNKTRGEKSQHGLGTSLISKLLPTPFECYNRWNLLCGEKFSRSFLNRIKATEKEIDKVQKTIERTIFWQGKTRFAAKYTGPTRIEYINSIFPDALFIHVKRDPRAVVYSWMDVDFWTDYAGKLKPRWTGGLPDDWQNEWRTYGSTPLALTAMQYRAIMLICEQEKKLLDSNRYMEVTYENFILDPLNVIKKILSFCKLNDSQLMFDYINSRQYLNQ
ncbi:MAG: sulfotransferase family protein, partial [Planctomycetota bacterium]